ncbi:MAG: phytoene synthase [Flavobacterium sp. MedPE-SWcel]|uniref:phytoene/squalene synthase family protein n=1 Tax=uncultured Flavobacterium sp. TaxID=165435 RepID=UPI0009227052|nr:phytoene/squalene synthase family protein [uncultured Flavobacterium sp.]OIQ21095.1 MAG: phytoene synthase [Flavobacterium sp. MedPE-SWcel]
MKALFDQSSIKISELVTNTYSTSFSLACKLLSPKIRPAIYAIYGFVRYADEIVDSFDGYDQELLINEFEREYYLALERKISLNPILNAFQQVVHDYNIEDEMIQSFLNSMKMDLSKKEYTNYDDYKKYIYGSADVVGLMCLKVFVHGNEEKYQELKDYSMKLGSAFQKVNFLRDLKDDGERLARSYFPNVDLFNLSKEDKNKIIEEIEKDFEEAYIGVKQLPLDAKLGVYTAYKYYKRLLVKLKKTPEKEIINTRIRVPNHIKLLILSKSYIRYQLNVL